jgi:hypothetical protein
MHPPTPTAYPQSRTGARLGPQSIRLLQCYHYDPDTHNISGVLETFPLDDCPVYYALSYTWGPAVEYDVGIESIERPLPACTLKIVDGTCGSIETLEVGANLSNFLLHLNNSRFRGHRYPPSNIPLWIDAICINQGDQTEKEAQIMLMGDIYSKASHVIVWLGSADSNLEHFQWMQDVVWPKIHRLLPSDESIEPADSLRFGNPLDRDFWIEQIGICRSSEHWVEAWKSYFRCFIQHQWFTRAWVVQEVCLSQSISMAWGAGYFQWEDVHSFLVWIFSSWSTLLMLIGKPLHKLEVGGKNVVELWQFRKQFLEILNNEAEIELPTFAAGEESKLEKQFLQLRDLLCVVLRPKKSSFDNDKVYSVLGIASKLLDCKLDPFTDNPGKSSADVYTWITSRILDHSLTLGILSEVEDRAHRKTQELPSWIPDLAIRPGHFAFDRFSTWDASGVRDGHVAHPKIHDKQLSVSGVEVGSISSVFKWQNNDEFVKAAFHLALEMGPIYSASGECRLEAVWRTVLADHISWDARDFHPPSNYCDGFCELVRDVLLDLRNANPTAESESAISAFEEMEKERISVPKKRKNSDANEEEGGIERGSNRSEHSESPSQEEEDYNSLNFFMHSLFVRDRCLFRTSNGYIGMGLSSIEVSDTVWLLEGGTVPYVLRRVPNDTRYSFFGDCYVHGIMRGEFITEELRNGFATVDII